MTELTFASYIVRLLALFTDAFGGRGGIAKFNRDLSYALTAPPLNADVSAIPYVEPVDSIRSLPEQFNYRTEGASSRLAFVSSALRATLSGSQSSLDGVLCGHLHLLPVGALVSLVSGTPLLLIIHGVDAWSPPSSPLIRWSISFVDRVVSVSRHTKKRFLTWANLTADQVHVIPNCIDSAPFDPGPKPDHLLDSYGLKDRTILLTLSRLSSEEQYKGHDEVIEILPDLVEDIPDIAYLICGDGDDRQRLEAKVRQFDISDRVVFTGYVPETEKADHYRLADVFVMPGRGEGFGIVYLEALACGIPVVASSLDASQEAVLDGEIGEVVDPTDREDLKEGILRALNRQRGSVPSSLGHFSKARFQERWQRVVSDWLSAS